MISHIKIILVITITNWIIGKTFVLHTEPKYLNVCETHSVRTGTNLI